MKAVRFTKAEAELMQDLLLHVGPLGPLAGVYDMKAMGLASCIRLKLQAAETAQSGIDAGALERALLTETSKVVELKAGQAYARASKVATAIGATMEQASLIGRWMESQGWLHGPLTLAGVLNKWHDWAARARATEPPPTLSPGLGATNAETGRSSQEAGRPTSRRRPPPGFGRKAP